MLDNITTFLKKKGKKEPADKSKNAAKERLHLVLMQDRANVSADFLEMMKLEIVDVIKKYIDVDETDMDVKLENRLNEDGTSGAPALYANIPIVGINEEKKKESIEIGKSKQVEDENKKNATKKKASTTTKVTKKKTVSASKSTDTKKKEEKKTTSKSNVLSKAIKKSTAEKAAKKSASK